MENISLPKGFLLSSINCEIKEGIKKKDLGLIYSEVPGNAFGVFTQNKVKSAPVIVSMNRIKNKIAQAIVVNSGNANACTGEQGIKDALTICKEVAKMLNIDENLVLVASTGVIGKYLPMDKILPKIPELINNLNREDIIGFEYSIMTTDKRPKIISTHFEIGGEICTITGFAKGSGMIHPNMATMLAFIISDINISQDLLELAFKEAIEDTFNMISVDGDTSTNDTVFIIANGLAKNPEIKEKDKNYENFKNQLTKVCEYLAIEIARDGEGATKLINVKVINAPDIKTAKILAKTVVSSNLVKTAIYGEDANWGRIMCALGYANCNYDPSKADIYLGDILVAKDGIYFHFDEDSAKKELSKSEITITIDLKDGNFSAQAWGCDLTEEYIQINAKYRT